MRVFSFTDMREMCCCGPGARTPLLIVPSLVAIRSTWAFIPTTVLAHVASRAVAGLLHVESSVDNLLFVIDHGEAEDGTPCCIIADGNVLGARRGEDITADSVARARSRTLGDNSIIKYVLSDSGATLNSAICNSDMLVTLGCSGGAALNDVRSSALCVLLGSAPEGLGASALGSALNGIGIPALRTVLDCSTLGPLLNGLGSSLLGSALDGSRLGSAPNSSVTGHIVYVHDIAIGHALHTLHVAYSSVYTVVPVLVGSRVGTWFVRFVVGQSCRSCSLSFFFISSWPARSIRAWNRRRAWSC
jgi:hypothetical protein